MMRRSLHQRREKRSDGRCDKQPGRKHALREILQRLRVGLRDDDHTELGALFLIEFFQSRRNTYALFGRQNIRRVSKKSLRDRDRLQITLRKRQPRGE